MKELTSLDINVYCFNKQSEIFNNSIKMNFLDWGHEVDARDQRLAI